MNSSSWQFSLKFILFLQALVAVICFIVWKLHPGYLCLIVFLGLPLSVIVWATVRIATRNGSERLFFHTSRPNSAEHPRRPVDGPRFLELIVLSGLLSAEELSEFSVRYSDEQWQQLCDQKKNLADEFVKHDLLTRWQANLLLDGKYKGFMLGHYKLLRLLGSGGMSSVYLAEHTIMRRRVALKILPKSKADDPIWHARFIEAAQWSSKITNEYFFHLLDLDHVGNTWYQALDYEPGMTLHSFVREEGPLHYLTAAKYVAQAAAGLEVLHTAGRVHCDVNPSHLFLTDTARIKILNYGMARKQIESGTKFDNLWESDNQDWTDYRAPEFDLASDQIGPQADIYSLGCTLYFLLTGQPPYPIGTAPQRIQQHWEAKLPVVRDGLPDVPSKLIDILQRMVVKNPSQRYATAGHLYRDLDAFLHDEGGENELAFVP